jgi:hypothetical protein
VSLMFDWVYFVEHYYIPNYVGWLFVGLLLCLPFVLLRQKMRVIFILGSIISFCTDYMFLSQNGQRGSLLVLLAIF